MYTDTRNNRIARLITSIFPNWHKSPVMCVCVCARAIVESMPVHVFCVLPAAQHDCKTHSLWPITAQNKPRWRYLLSPRGSRWMWHWQCKQLCLLSNCASARYNRRSSVCGVDLKSLCDSLSVITYMAARRVQLSGTVCQQLELLCAVTLCSQRCVILLPVFFIFSLSFCF